ncbi:MAG: glycosyl hydrolase [Planctomycetota bacterium]|nr:glycosyl hydrolase [Planctomycetota bacterium]
MGRAVEWTEEIWLNPPSIYRSAPFWSWNDRLNTERLCRQIGQMHSAGMGGFFMHSRDGLKTPYLSEQWFACVDACIEHARRFGMKAYLYDEDRWPSGSAGGIVTRNRPDLGVHLLVALRRERAPADTERVREFAVKFDDSGHVLDYRSLKKDECPADGETLISFAVAPSDPERWFNDAPYLDTLSAEAVDQFINLTHRAYAERFGKDFGGVVPAIFTDEPNYSHGSVRMDGLIAALPWTKHLPRQFERRRGYDLRDHLVELAFASPGDCFSKVRHDYYRTLTELFVENFSVRIGRWCKRNGIVLTGHYNAEGTLPFQTQHIGSAMPHYAHQQWPGIDILTDQRDEIATVKQCTSVAAQLGRERVLSELYGCTGWDWPLEGHKFNAGWQYVLGVNFRCPHLSLYSLAGAGKRDYPASIFTHSPWWKYYRTVEDYFARLSVMLTCGKCVRDVLVIHPIESAWGLFTPTSECPEAPSSGPVVELDNAFQSLLTGLLDGQYDYDLADESLLGRYGKITNKGLLAIGRMKYRLVVVPPTVTLRVSTVVLLKEFISAGGQVLFAGSMPERIDAEVSDKLSDLLRQSGRCSPDPQAVVEAVEDRLERRVIVTEKGRRTEYVWTMLRKVKGGQLLFIQSCDRKAGHDVHLSVVAKKPVVLWDAMTGQRRQIKSSSSGGKAEFDLHLPPTGSALVSMGLRVQADEPAETPTVVSTFDSTPPWKIELLEPNSFPLDFCRFRIEEGDFSDPVPVLLADEKIRTNFGLPNRDYAAQQPWYLAETGRADRKPLGRCEMMFNFHLSDTPESLHVAIERPEDFEIIINGQTVASEPVGWWVDEDLKTIYIGHAVKAGENELLLKFDYRSDMELEELHLIGPFGVRQTGAKPTFDGYTLTAPPTELPAGSWAGHGLDFYGGAVKYRIVMPDSVRSAIREGRRIRMALPGIRCTAAAIHVGDETFVLPWPPMSADITDSLAAEAHEICVEVIGGRKNILGPLHTPWGGWTGPNHFSPHDEQWTDEYILNDHGLTASPVFEIME